MPHEIKIAVPDDYHADVACPSCGSDITRHVESLYDGAPETAIGGEHACPVCGTRILIGVFRPPALFSAHVPAVDGVINLAASRVRRRNRNE